jgi:chaperonin GroEL (HSP60 family)
MFHALGHLGLQDTSLKDRLVLQVGDMEKLGIYESFKVKQAVLMSATEAAEMIMRVDEIIKCAPRKREGMGHGM